MSRLRTIHASPQRLARISCISLLDPSPTRSTHLVGAYLVRYDASRYNFSSTASDISLSVNELPSTKSAVLLQRVAAAWWVCSMDPQCGSVKLTLARSNARICREAHLEFYRQIHSLRVCHDRSPRFPQVHIASFNVSCMFWFAKNTILAE